MDVLLGWLPTIVLVGWFVVGVLIDPRRLGLGVLLMLNLGAALLTIVALASEVAVDLAGESFLTYALLVILVGVVALVALLGVFLVVNAITMWRKEGLGLAPRISGLIGAAMLAYVVLGVIAAIFGVPEIMPVLLFVGLPAGYVAFLFASFLLYSLLYVWFANRFGRPVDAVVVLGSGLGGGERVTPLLAGRLERGRKAFEKARAAGKDPVLIVSGGKGSDEQLSEAEAMSKWLVERGFPEEHLVLEDRSTDTEENLDFSEDLIRAENRNSRVAVATSNYHAFRAAIIMRKEGLKGYTVGCRTARYYWPSATVREFLAILLEHSRTNVVIVALLTLPLVFYVIQLLVSLVGLGR